jgi:predicted nucleotidyltransferase
MGTIVPEMGAASEAAFAVAPTNGDALSSTLFGKTRRIILALLYSHPDESFYLRQIARFVEAGQGGVQRELQRLTDAQIITRTVRGRTAFYQANRDCPIFPELHSLVLKTAGVVEVLRTALLPLSDRIQVAFVYGSIARAEPKAGSDIDLFVIGPVGFGEIVDALTDAQSRLAREINPTVYDVADFQSRLAKKEHFVSALVDQPKLFVIGSEHEFDQLARRRLARRA